MACVMFKVVANSVATISTTNVSNYVNQTRDLLQFPSLSLFFSSDNGDDGDGNRGKHVTTRHRVVRLASFDDASTWTTSGGLSVDATGSVRFSAECSAYAAPRGFLIFLSSRFKT